MNRWCCRTMHKLGRRKQRRTWREHTMTTTHLDLDQWDEANRLKNHNCWPDRLFRLPPIRASACGLNYQKNLSQERCYSLCQRDSGAVEVWGLAECHKECQYKVYSTRKPPIKTIKLEEAQQNMMIEHMSLDPECAPNDPKLIPIARGIKTHMMTLFWLGMPNKFRSNVYKKAKPVNVSNRWFEEPQASF